MSPLGTSAYPKDGCVKLGWLIGMDRVRNCGTVFFLTRSGERRWSAGGDVAGPLLAPVGEVHEQAKPGIEGQSRRQRGRRGVRRIGQKAAERTVMIVTCRRITAEVGQRPTGREVGRERGLVGSLGCHARRRHEACDEHHEGRREGNGVMAQGSAHETIYRHLRAREKALFVTAVWLRRDWR
jgi:hypothetical protein